MHTKNGIMWKRRERIKQTYRKSLISFSIFEKGGGFVAGRGGGGGRLEIFAAGVIANVAWNAICSRDVGFSFDDSRYPRYTCPWQIARETVRINCLHERRRRLHTHSMATSNRAATKATSIRLPLFPPLAPDAILRIFSYRELHSLPFHLLLADTCDDSLSPSTQTPLCAPSSSADSFFFFFLLSARRSSAVWRARFCKTFKRAPSSPCVSHYRYFSQRLSYPCVYACVRVFRVSYRPRVFVNGLTINFRHIISSLPVGDTCFRQFLFFISASSRGWRFCSFQFRVNPVSISIFNV